MSTNEARMLWVGCVLVGMAMAGETAAQLSTNARSGRFTRGYGNVEDVQSIVLALDFQKGIALDPIGGNGSNWFGGQPLTYTLFHYNATNPASAGGTNGRIAYQVPIVAFGSRMGGSPLYVGTQYRFGAAAGFNYWGIEEPMFFMSVHDKRSNYTWVDDVSFRMPRTDDTNAWTEFATNGYAISKTRWGMRTTIADHPGTRWALDNDEFTDSYLLTHEAVDNSATNYLFEFYALGYFYGDYAMSLLTNGVSTWTELYSIEFETRPSSRVLFIDQPHFRGEPLPPEYAGKSVEELTNFTATVTNQIWITNSANYFALDQSPELRQHPILDKFVTDMRYDPLALTEFVLNEIEITDPMAFGNSNYVPKHSINLGGINRSALGTFLERQGSPWEQCALLVYLLRAAGQPAAYVFPTNNNLKMLDTRLSKLLRMQLKGALENDGDPFITNSLITVNYPWVVANINSNRVVHIFPWLKDTEVVEGLNLYDYMPTNYDSGYKWARQYFYGDTNILGLSTESDVPRILFPKFIEQTLRTNQPGISINDLGVRAFNRRHSYARWEDFPRPTVLSNQTQVAVISNLVAVSNVLTWMSAPFDTLRVQVLRNTTTLFDTGEMRTADLNGRKFLLFTNAGNLNLWLAPYRPSITNQSGFSNDSTLLSNQVLQTSVLTGDTNLIVRLTHLRHQYQSSSNSAPSFNLSEWQSVTNELVYSKADVAGICLNFGRVNARMLNPHMEDYWHEERKKQTNSAHIPAKQDYQGTAAYLIGMGYHEKRSRFQELNQEWHKIRQLSRYSAGLGKLATVVVTNVNKVQPGVDMIAADLVRAANGTLHPDSAIDYRAAFDSFGWLDMVSSSAEEHAIINSVFGETNSISTTRLLQLAQRRSNANRVGIIELHSYDYVTKGDQTNLGYSATTKLKEYDSALWAAVTNTFVLERDPHYSTVFITPASITNDNGSYKGMAAFIYGSFGYAALISGNKNGGEGSYYNNFDVSSGLSYLPYSLFGADDGSFEFNATDPSWTQVVAPLSPTDVARITQAIYQLIGSPYQWDLSTDISVTLNLPNILRETTRGGRDRGFLGFPDVLRTVLAFVSDPVNALTGEFYIDATDLTLPGPMPLQVRRSYLSQNRSDNQFGVGWKMNYMPYLVVTTNASNVPFIYAAEPDGSVMLYRGTNDVWRPTPADNPSLNNHSTAGIGSTANMFNARIERLVTNTIETWFLYGSDGSVRRFETSSEFEIVSGTNHLERTRPYLREWKDNRENFYRFSYGTNSSAPDFGQLVRIESSNGSFLGLRYDVYARVIEAYTGDARRLFYDYDQFGDLVRVTLPDASEILYEYQHYTFTSTNGSTVYTNLDSTHLLIREIKPDGRTLENFYDSQRRVTVQKATVGPDLQTYTNGVFTYSNNFSLTNAHTNLVTGYTLIADAYNRTTRYDYTNTLITSITNPLGHVTLQDWFEPGETNKPGYYQRSLEKVTDVRGLQTFYKYDTNGNLTSTIVQGDLTGAGNTSEQALSTAAYTTNNLITESVDPAGATNRYFYTNTWLLSRIEMHPTNATGSSIISNVFVYYSATNTTTNGTRIFTNIALGLRQKEIRAFGTADAATNEWAYDGRGFPTTEIRYTGTSDPNVTNMLFYNARGELVEQTDAAGRKMRLAYDGLGRPIYREVFESNQIVPLSWEYSYYNPNGNLVWRDGPRYDPEDYLWNDYDSAGRHTQQILWRSRAKADGSGVEAVPAYDGFATSFKEYDLFGNLTRSIDPRGAVSSNSYDGIGRLITRRVMETNTVLASEGFAYEPGGEMTFRTNALGGISETKYTSRGKHHYRSDFDGSTNGWRYYADGHLHKEFISNGNFWETAYDDANRKITKIFKSAAGASLATNISELDRRGNVIRTVDAAGFAFTNVVDHLDRPKGSAGPVIAYEHPVGAPALPGGNPPSVQQTTTNFYGVAGQVITNINALGEKAISYFDALGRPTRTEIRSAANAIVRETSYAYAANHHSVSETNGSGATAIISTTHTDTEDKIVLSIMYPASGVQHFSRLEYDATGNLLSQTVNSKTNSAATLWQTQSLTYDGLNRLRSKTEKDGALTTFERDAGANITNQMMPGGLAWRARYNSAGQLLEDYDIAGSTGANTNIYAYYGAASPFAGLLHTKTDGRGVIATNIYDAYLRLATNRSTGPFDEHKLTTTWNYDVRGFVTNVSENFAISATGPATKILRTFNPYGRAKSESVFIGGLPEYGVMQSWDSGGRRRQLGFGMHGTAFGWRADGALLSATDPSGGGIYTYDTAGQLLTRSIGTSRTTTITQRDGAGRLLVVSNTIAGAAKFTETLTWTGDGLPANDTMVRTGTGGFTDERAYFYANQSRRLIEERLNLDATKRWTNIYEFDAVTDGGAGVMTKAGSSWSGATNSLLRVVSETNTARKIFASGTNNGEATVSAFLDGHPVPVTQIGTQKLEWRATLELTPGAHDLRAEALHPFMLYTASATNYFSNTGPAEIISSTHDGSGRVTSRVWKTGSTTNRTQTFVWDGRGRLLKTVERDSSQAGFDEVAVYDPLGRRIRLSNIPYTNGIAISNSIITLDSIYDPEVEFLELGVSKNGDTTWKLYGPDLNGVYGGLNGVGGFEAIIPGAELFCPVISDAHGNLHGIYDQGHAMFEWFSSRVTAFGAVPGYRPVPYAESTRLSLAHASSYRGKYGDANGTIALGARNLLWDAGLFLSPDPLGHNANENLYTAFNGRLDMFDADGRVATAIGNAISATARETWNHSIFGNAPPPREVVVQRDPTQSFWSRLFGVRYVDQNGNRVEPSLDIVRVDSRGISVDPLGGEPPGGSTVRAGARTGVSLWSRIVSFFRGGGDDAARGLSQNANFAQRTYSQAFSSGGTLAGRSVDEVAAGLRSGAMKPGDVPIQYIVRDGNTLILNTRSAQALQQAGIPRSQWSAVNMTGNAAAEARLTRQLQQNGLTSQGTPTVTPGRP